jgi:hypothetical protein
MIMNFSKMDQEVEDTTRSEEWIDDFHAISTPTPACSVTMSAPSSIGKANDCYEEEEENFTSSSWRANEPIKEIGVTVEKGTIFLEGQLKDDLSNPEIKQVRFAIPKDSFSPNTSKMQNTLQLCLFGVDFSFQIDDDLLADADSMLFPHHVTSYLREVLFNSPGN